jgi:N-acetylmuramoyl-L-alanine amidase
MSTRHHWKPLVVGALAAWTAVSLCTPAKALDIRDYYSPKNTKRPRRPRTDYIILHTTEGAAKGSLDKVRRNGETHYFIDERGRVYRIISRYRVAFHCGRSMWNGRVNIDNSAIGIEVVGYHNKGITTAQRNAIKELVEELQRIYDLPDERVLTHSMVAYGAPNRWHKRSHRGRKRCGMLFAKRSERLKLGLERQPTSDPDVRAGRLVVADPYLAKVLYGSAKEQEVAVAHYTRSDANVIAAGRSAWDIARDRYNSHDTVYVFPGKKQVRGDAISDWKKIPPGTRVVLGSDQRDNEVELVKRLGVDGKTPGDIAGDEYASKTTVYFLPGGQVKTGDQFAQGDWSKVPNKTLMLVGYTNGGYITAKRSAFDICGARWNEPSTYYRFADGSLKPGDRVSEKSIPRNTRVFFRN